MSTTVIPAKAEFTLYGITVEIMGLTQWVFYHHSLQVVEAELERRRVTYFAVLANELGTAEHYITRLLNERKSLKVRKCHLKVDIHDG